MQASCMENVPNCSGNNVNINGLCYPILFNMDDKCENTFEKSDYNISIPYNNIATPYSANILECVEKCNSMDNCNSIKFYYGNSKQGSGSETEGDGLCSLMTNTSTDPVNVSPYEMSNSLSDYTCASVYFKNKTKNGTSSCFNMIDPASKKALNIDISKGVSQSMTPRILSTYGAECRSSVGSSSSLDPTSDNLLLSTMAEWCDTNPDTDVCNKFCGGRYSDVCINSFPIKFIASLAVFMVVIFMFVYVFTKTDISKNHKKIFYIVSSIVILLSVILTIYFGVKELKKKYTGNLSDSSRWDKLSQKNCDMDPNYKCLNLCKDSLGNCDCQSIGLNSQCDNPIDGDRPIIYLYLAGGSGNMLTPDYNNNGVCGISTGSAQNYFIVDASDVNIYSGHTLCAILQSGQCVGTASQLSTQTTDKTVLAMGCNVKQQYNFVFTSTKNPMGTPICYGEEVYLRTGDYGFKAIGNNYFETTPFGENESKFILIRKY